MNPPVTEPEVLTEVPVALKRLVRYIVRGFYDIEHALAIDLLVHHPCIREEDLLDLLKFDQKQLRSLVNTLKNDKFIKVRMRMETSEDGRTSKQNYYFINYSTFVNVCKYKLDHMRRKIEMEERNMTSRASFKCPGCEKTFTDLEAGQLFDPYTGEMKCTYCHTEVEEGSSAESKTDARTLMVKFNEQVEPIFTLLREVEDVKLSQELLEPEPVDLGRRTGSTGKHSSKGWSGERRTGTFNDADVGMTISIEDQDHVAAPAAPLKEQPVWMKQSTIKGAEEDNMLSDIGMASRASDQPMRTQESDDIMKTLLAHEKKASSTPAIIPGARVPVSDDSSSSDSESEFSFKPPTISIPIEPAPSVSDEEEEEATVMVGGQPVPYSDITEEMTQKMTAAERDNYIRLGQEMYQDMYD